MPRRNKRCNRHRPRLQPKGALCEVALRRRFSSYLQLPAASALPGQLPARLIELLGLDSPQSTGFRLLWIGIVALAERYDPSLYRRLMGFPDDLPDLKRLRPPGGNTRPEGVRTSSFVKRKDGTLAATY